jgi:segregation and condensation protein B
LFATTRQFLDDLGLDSLDQLPLLTQSDPQMSALANALEDEPLQAILSLEELSTEPSSAHASVADAAESPHLSLPDGDGNPHS